MRVILIADVDDLGHKGDVVDVADGYARNYLVPRSYAVKATDGALLQAESMRLAREEALRAARDEAETFAQSLTGTRVVVAAHAGDEGKLFGSIGTIEIAKAITDAGVDVSKSEVRLSEGAFRHIGEFEVIVGLHSDVQATLKLSIVAE